MSASQLWENHTLARPPNRRRAPDVISNAEAAFKKATTKPIEPAPVARAPSLPGAKELVSLRIDPDVLERFQEDGPGWQDRMNAALRAASGVGQD